MKYKTVRVRTYSYKKNGKTVTVKSHYKKVPAPDLVAVTKSEYLARFNKRDQKSRHSDRLRSSKKTLYGNSVKLLPKNWTTKNYDWDGIDVNFYPKKVKVNGAIVHRIGGYWGDSGTPEFRKIAKNGKPYLRYLQWGEGGDHPLKRVNVIDLKERDSVFYKNHDYIVKSIKLTDKGRPPRFSFILVPFDRADFSYKDINFEIPLSETKKYNFNLVLFPSSGDRNNTIREMVKFSKSQEKKDIEAGYLLNIVNDAKALRNILSKRYPKVAFKVTPRKFWYGEPYGYGGAIDIVYQAPEKIPEIDTEAQKYRKTVYHSAVSGKKLSEPMRINVFVEYKKGPYKKTKRVIKTTRKKPTSKATGKSKGHIAFAGDYELFKMNGDVFRSKKSNYIDTMGYRSDARFEGTEAWFKQNRDYVIEGLSK